MVLHFLEMYVQVTQSEKSVKNVSGFHKLYENFPCVQTYKQAVYYILSASVLESFAKIVVTFYQKRQVNQIKTSSFILPQIKTYCHFTVFKLHRKESWDRFVVYLVKLFCLFYTNSTMCKHDFNFNLSRSVLFKWIGRCLFLIVLLCQILVLNQYLVLYAKSSSFQAFTLAYAPAVLLWARGQMNSRQREVASGVWFLYIIPLCIHSGWILGTLMTEIDVSSPVLDHGFVKYPLSATALVYMLLDAEELEPKLYMKLNWPVIVDILDIVNLLDAIIDPLKTTILPNDIHYCICAFAIVILVILTFNFAIPVREALMNTDDTNEVQVKIYTIYIIVQAVVINFPFLAIRLVLHYKFKSGASVFAFKNFLVIIANFTEVRYGCSEREEKVTANVVNGHTPSNTEESASVIQSNQSSRMGDDTSSIDSSVRRTQRVERDERQRSRLLNLQDREDPEEIIVLS